MAFDDFLRKFGALTEEYKFYNGEVTLRYDVAAHIYLLVTDNGDLEPVYGTTSVCHIIDKSHALIPWGVKMMLQKALKTIPVAETNGTYILTLAEIEKWLSSSKDAHKEKLEEAGAIGHIAHNWIEDYIKLQLAGDVQGTEKHLAEFPKDERASNASVAASTWMSNHNVRWKCTERKIYSRRHKYAGTMDGLALVDSCDNPRCCPNAFKDRLSVIDWKTSNYLYLEYLLQTAAYEQAYEEETSEVIEDRWIIRLGKDDGEFEAWHVENHNFQEDIQAFLTCLTLVRSVKSIEARLKERKDNLRAAIKAEKKAAKALKEAEERVAKAEAKAKKDQERLAALALECGYAKKYKAKKKPSCKTNNDGPCVSCATKWIEKTQKEIPKAADLGSLLSVLGAPKAVEVTVGFELRHLAMNCDGEHGVGLCYDPNCWQGHNPRLLLGAGTI